MNSRAVWPASFQLLEMCRLPLACVCLVRVGLLVVCVGRELVQVASTPRLLPIVLSTISKRAGGFTTRTRDRLSAVAQQSRTYTASMSWVCLWLCLCVRVGGWGDHGLLSCRVFLCCVRCCMHTLSAHTAPCMPHDSSTSLSNHSPGWQPRTTTGCIFWLLSKWGKRRSNAHT